MKLGILFLMVVGCAATGPEPDDQEAETAPAQIDGKADAASFAGQYRQHATHHSDGDITAVKLDGSGTYVRGRCYHANCSLLADETDHYDSYTSSSGKSYLRFWSWTPVRDADGNLTRNTLISDVWEVRKTSYGIQLRKAYTTKWLSLYKTSDTSACTATGGTYSAGSCTCPGNTPNMWASTIFVGGAGGCIANPGSNETNCDDSDGEWTDDDAAPNGAFCLCGYGRYLAADGSCTDL